MPTIITRSRRKLLWVKAGGLLPLDAGGKIRSFQILRQLGRRYEITVYTFYPRPENDLHHTLEEYIERVVSVPMDLPENGSARHYLQYLRTCFSWHPYTMQKFCTGETRSKLRKILESDAFNLIICDFIYPAGIIPWKHPVPKILFTHNVEGQIWKRHAKYCSNPLWRLAFWKESIELNRAERRYLPEADLVLAVSQPDLDHFATFIQRDKLRLIPTGVDTEYFRHISNEEEPNRVVFTGSMDWMPNEEGVINFLKEIWPRVVEFKPDISFTIVGRNPSDKLRKLAASNHQVVVTGFVEDIRPYLNQCAVYVVPLLSGSGTRIKIFEAMASGKAIVSTTLGAEGLPIVDGETVLLRDDPIWFLDVFSGTGTISFTEKTQPEYLFRTLLPQCVSIMARLP